MVGDGGGAGRDQRDASRCPIMSTTTTRPPNFRHISNSQPVIKSHQLTREWLEKIRNGAEEVPQDGCALERPTRPVHAQGWSRVT